MAEEERGWLGELAPLKIACNDSDCSRGLHSYRLTPKQKKAGEAGKCRYCGQSPVDWERIRRLDPSDMDYTVSALNTEYVRNCFWETAIDQRVLNHARRKGLEGLRVGARRTLEAKIGRLNEYWDGRQTPKSGNIIYLGQYATATCCRRCLETWYGIPRDVELTSEQLEYFTDLIMLFIRLRISTLSEHGETIPPIRKAAR